MHTTVGQRIEALAAEKGLPSGKALAALFGVSYETLRKWRSGDAAPNRSRQLVVAKVLGCKPEAFMFGDEKPVRPNFMVPISDGGEALAREFDAIKNLDVKWALFPKLMNEIRRASEVSPAPVAAPKKVRDPSSKRAPGKSPA